MRAAHKLREHALGQHRVGEIEAGELILVRPRRDREVLDEPIVERAVVFELKRANRVRDALDGVRLAVSKIVARINGPRLAGARMLSVQDAIEHRIAQIDVARAHVDLGAQYARTVGKFAGAHAAKEIEIFLDAALPIRAVDAGFGQRAARGPHFFLRLVVHVGLAGTDQIFGPLVELIEIIGRVKEILAPIKSEPAHVALDGVDIFLRFLGRIGIVVAQITVAAEFLGHAEIQANRLGVPDMQVAVRLRREAGHDALDPARSEVPAHDVADEILARFPRGGFCDAHVAIVSPAGAAIPRRGAPGLNKLTRSVKSR